MIYVSGSSGLIGKSLCEQISYIKVSYRDTVDGVEFGTHPNATLIHLASCSNTRYKIDSAEELYQKEVLTSLELFKKFYKANPDGRIIFLSSCGDLHWTYINGQILNESFAPTPRTIHGSHKILIENYGQILAREYGGKFISLRVSNVYGGKIESNRINGLIDRYYYSLKNNQSMEIYCNPNNIFDWIHIDDVVDCIIQSICYMHSDVFLVGSGESLSVKEVLDYLCETEGSIDITYKDVQEKPTYVRISSAKVYTRLGWEPIHRLKV